MFNPYTQNPDGLLFLSEGKVLDKVTSAKNSVGTYVRKKKLVFLKSCEYTRFDTKDKSFWYKKLMDLTRSERQGYVISEKTDMIDIWGMADAWVKRRNNIWKYLKKMIKYKYKFTEEFLEDRDEVYDILVDLQDDFNECRRVRIVFQTFKEWKTEFKNQTNESTSFRNNIFTDALKFNELEVDIKAMYTKYDKAKDPKEKEELERRYNETAKIYNAAYKLFDILHKTINSELHRPVPLEKPEKGKKR